jgi:hypothetical protein
MLLEAQTVVPHAPISPTQNMPTVTDQKSATPIRWWNWRHVVLSTCLLADVVYVVLIAGGIGWTGQDRVLPTQLSQIFVGVLCTATATAVGFLLAGKVYDKLDRLQRRQDTQFAVLVTQYTELRAAGEARREAEEKTVPLAGAAQRVVGVYASAVAVQRATEEPREGLVGAVVDGLEQRLAEQIEDFGNRKFWRGVAGCAKVGLDGVGQDADVVPLQSVRPARSQPPA